MTELSLLILGLKLLGSLRNVMSKDSRNLFIPFSKVCGLKNMFIEYRWLLSSADNLCKQFGPRSGPTDLGSWSGSKRLTFFKINFGLRSGSTDCGSWSGSKLLTFFKIIFFSKKQFQEQYQSVKRFGSKSGPTFCRSWSGFKMFSKVTSRRQKVAANKERVHNYLTHLYTCSLNPNTIEFWPFKMIWALIWDFQQCGTLTWIDSGEPVQPPFKLRKSR